MLFMPGGVLQEAEAYMGLHPSHWDSGSLADLGVSGRCLSGRDLQGRVSAKDEGGRCGSDSWKQERGRTDGVGRASDSRECRSEDPQPGRWRLQLRALLKKDQVSCRNGLD